MKNFWRMRDFSLFSVPYVYVDHSSYQADQLFAQNKVRIKFKGECAKEESPYRIVFCKVIKKDAERFEEALDKLKNKMLLLGYRDYPDVCSEITKMIEDGMKARERLCHVCRHTCCTNYAKSGMNPKILQYIMGHADVSVTLDTYTHIKEDDAKEEMERLSFLSAKEA